MLSIVKRDFKNKFKFSKVVKRNFEVGYCNFALQYIAYLL